MAATPEGHSAHRFVVSIGSELVAAFTECTLPSLEIETTEQKEGGLNSYSHVLPGRRKTGRVTLKKGVVKGSELMKLYNKVLDGKIDEAIKDVSIILFDSMSKIIGWWYFEKAVPVKWSGPQFKADQGALAIETLEFQIQDFYYVPA